MDETVAPKSKALTPNPKDLFGAVKVSLTKLPAVAIAHAAHAMMDGAQKYGPYNWRDKKVIASIYVDAARRHLDNWFEGQELAKDSEVHHLGHAIACCAILLDAQETGNLIDDRPGRDAVVDRVFDRLSEIVKRRRAPQPSTHFVAVRDFTGPPKTGDVVPVEIRSGETLNDAIQRTSREIKTAELIAHAKQGAPPELPAWQRAEIGDIIIFRDNEGGCHRIAAVSATDNAHPRKRVAIEFRDRQHYWLLNCDVLEIRRTAERPAADTRPSECE